jgi:hypothetical protein
MITRRDTGNRVDDWEQPPQPGGDRPPSRHSWLMLACCIPIIVIAVALVATGVVSKSFLIVAVICTVMMALMMRGMGHGNHSRM